MRLARRFLVPLATLVAALVGWAGLARPAGAHGAVGTMGIQVLPGAAPLTAEVRVLLEYANDREVAPGASVIAVAADPGGTTTARQTLIDRGNGVYETTLTMPAAGPWTVTVTATEPTATAQATVVVSAAPAPSSSSGTLEGDLDDAPDDRADPGDPSDTSDGPSPVVLAGIAVMLVAGAVLAFRVVRRR